MKPIILTVGEKKNIKNNKYLGTLNQVTFNCLLHKLLNHSQFNMGKLSYVVVLNCLNNNERTFQY